MAPRATKPGPAASSSARERDATGHSAKPNAGAGFGLALLLAALALAVFAAPAQATIFGPRAGHSPNADDIRTAYWVAITIAALLVLAVHVFLIAAIFRFRARRGLVSATKARDQLGWEPLVSYEEGMRRTHEWLRAERLV